jgi:ABC-type glycerol-3-phosphate transport system substrate-binding protein
MLNSHTMGVTRTTKAVEEAWAWVKWSCGRDFAVDRLVSGAGGPVGRPDVWRNDQVLRTIPELRDWADLMERARPNHIPANLRGQEIEETMDRNLNAVWRGQVGPTDGIKQTVTEIQQVLNLPRG